MSIKNIGWLLAAALVAIGLVVVVVGIIVATNVETVSTTWDRFEAGRSEKVRAVNALRRELGYGGLIHHLKNFVLRREIERLREAKAKLGGALVDIAHFRGHGTNAAEEAALQFQPDLFLLDVMMPGIDGQAS